MLKYFIFCVCRQANERDFMIKAKYVPATIRRLSNVIRFTLNQIISIIMRRMGVHAIPSINRDDGDD